MRRIYRFPNTPKLARLKLAVEARNGKLRASVSGPGSLFYSPLIFYYLKLHSAIGVLATREGAYVYSLHVPPIPSAAHNRQLESFLKTWLFKTKNPFAATIAVTDACSLSCVHCSVPSGRSSSPRLTLAEIRRTVAECLALGVTNITFTGGEPLLRTDLEDCIAAVPSDFAIVQIFTSAEGLDEDRASSLKKAGAHAVQISLDSPDPGEHDRRRGCPGLFERVARGVRNARQADLLVGLSTYASNESVPQGQLTRIAALAADWGCQEISVFDLIPTGKLLRNPEVALTAANRGLLLRETKALNRRYRGRLRIVTQTWTNCGRGFARFVGCLAGHYQFHVSSRGDMMPCDFTPLSFGNIRNATLQDLWQKLVRHPAYRRSRHGCRMQDSGFRADYIDPIPQDAELPYSMKIE